ncbi:hypothetical protein QTP70_033760 [Hemibagrus guttatus]|uniref:IF rod domain-containing protein n=1 Tax=Hemibagrus guttatus TaxID=175788 RepID=A0AAE0R3F1_9TELE|nr:hypothetical protein QTP70_033760 [Hemibagrus guttatus]
MCLPLYFTTADTHTHTPTLTNSTIEQVPPQPPHLLHLAAAMNSRKHVSTTRKVANFSSRSLDSHAGSERTIPRLGNSYFGFGNQDAHRSSVNALVMDRSLLEPLQLDLDPNIRAVKVQEKEQIKTLNDRFASFINKVCHLEQQNKMLETKLRLLQSGPQTQSNMESVFKMYIGNLESQLKNLNTSKELLKAKLWNSRSLVEENKHKYEEEINKRYKAENDFVSIKKDADAGYFGRINLEEERSEIQQHLDFFKALYAEEVRELKEQLKDTSVVVEMDNSRQLNMEQVVKEVKSQYEEVSARSRQEAEAWYQKKDKKLDVQSCLARVKESCDTVERGRSRYEELYEATERTAGAPSARRGQAQDPHYRQLHGRILDNIICQTQTRFQDHEKLMFVTLLDPQKFQEYKKKFLHAAFSSLIQSHGALFDLSRLKTELIVMYAMDDFTGKSPTDLLDFLHQKNLSESMGQLYTLFELVSSQVEQHSSEMKRAKSEISELKRLITKLQADIAMVKAECKSTDGRIEEAEHRGEEAVFGAKRKLKELQEAHLKAKQGMARQVHEYQDLMNIKMALDIEISTYKKLLEGEEQRTGPVIRVQSVTKPSHPQPVDVITCTNVLIKMIDTRDKSNISVKD